MAAKVSASAVNGMPRAAVRRLLNVHLASPSASCENEFRRSSAEESLVCVFNLSPEPLKVSLDGEADELWGQAQERLKGRLVLGANGFAIFGERAGSRLQIKFTRRARVRG